MGNARSSLDNLIYIRSWTAAEVGELQEVLRRQRNVMAVDRATFNEFVGGRNPGASRIFENLDADCDGKVDTFEVLLTLILWCCATWTEKLSLLFQCFDFNAKGALRFPEFLLMVATAARATERFAALPPGFDTFAAFRDTASTAFNGRQAGELSMEEFGGWFDDSGIAQQLREFVDQHQGNDAPEVVEAQLRERIRMLEYHVQELAQEVAEIHGTAEDLRGNADEGEHRTLWDKLDSLLARLNSASESQKSELAELVASLNGEVENNGPAALVDPRTRSKHGQLIAEIEALERHSCGYLREARNVLAKLVELASDDRDMMPEEPVVAPPPSYPPRPSTAGEDPEAAARRLRLLDRELRRRRGRQVVVASPSASAKHGGASRGLTSQAATLDAASGASTSGIAETTLPGMGTAAAQSDHDGGEDGMPVVVAFAAFEPPESEETQMLRMEPGDEIVVLGQDGQGWWYGRKSNGSEGWFPPAYVQLRK
mmetsp:Transcript_119253/g.338125  ORF Transcript_119253/g.338125 Transcript_119253/m.338125 type:complete len:486 (-) Transcript_119253:104-1561(-)